MEHEVLGIVNDLGTASLRKLEAVEEASSHEIGDTCYFFLGLLVDRLFEHLGYLLPKLDIVREESEGDSGDMENILHARNRYLKQPL